MENKISEYLKLMNSVQIDRALKVVFELLSETNTYIDSEAPWKLKNSNYDRMNTVLFVSIEIIRRSTILLYPIIPESCEKILALMNYNKENINFNFYDYFDKNDIKINDPFPIFPRID